MGLAATRLDLNLTDLLCLGTLASAGPLTAGQLATLIGVARGAVTGLIDRLERQGRVRRERDAAERRRIVLHPIPACEAAIAPPFCRC